MKAVPYTVLPRVLLIFSLKFGYLVRLYLEHCSYLYFYLYLLYVYSDMKSTYVSLHLSLPLPLSLPPLPL